MQLTSLEMNNMIDVILERIKNELYLNNQQNNIDDYLNKIGCDDLIYSYDTYFNPKKAKILVIGDSCISKDVILGICKKNGIDAKHIEFLLDYDKLTNFDFSKLAYNDNYSDIIIGPCPHKTKGITSYGSAISMMENHPEMYPKLIKARTANELKITKASFENALLQTQFYNRY